MTDKEKTKAYLEGRRSYALNGLFPAFIPYKENTCGLGMFWSGHKEAHKEHHASGLTLADFRDQAGY